MTIDVFISVGRTATPEQEAFVSAVEEYLRANGLNPRALGRSDFSSLQPLKFIEQVMNDCSGTVVLAFERIHVFEGVELEGGADEKQIIDAKVPTIWNQIEAAMAYVLKQPLLVIVEKGLRNEGLLEFGYDWYVQWVNVDPAIVEGREFVGVFADWKKRVITYHQSKERNNV